MTREKQSGYPFQISFCKYGGSAILQNQLCRTQKQSFQSLNLLESKMRMRTTIRVNGRTKTRLSFSANDKLPINQKTAVRKESFNKVIINKIPAEKKAPIITPERSRRFGSSSPNFFPKTKTRSITRIDPPKANTCVPMKLNPNRKERTAPKVPPLEMPRMYGSASGFISIAWKTAPAIDSPPPTAIAKRMRGRRISKII